jgi:hypothetical protein
LIQLVVHDINLLELCLRLADFKAGPVVTVSQTATIVSVSKSELVIPIEYFTDSNKVVVVAKFSDGWKVSVLHVVTDLYIRISESVCESIGFNHGNFLNLIVCEYSLFGLIESLLQLISGLVLRACHAS